MLYFMPEIVYHDRKPLLSVDVHPTIKDGNYRMVTSSTAHDIRIWEFAFKDDAIGNSGVGVSFVTRLEGHHTTVTQVRFSPNADVNLLASGDVHGRIFIWKLSNKTSPGNTEKWLRSKVFYHESDVTAMCWAPHGKHIASVSGDATLRVHNGLTGRHKFIVRNLRYYPNGVTYDPQGKYIVTMSTDGKTDLICAEKGTRLRYFGIFELSHIFIGNVEFKEKKYRMFHDDLFTSYTRICDFSPCGQLMCLPAGRLQTSSGDTFYCSYVYKRTALDQDKPTLILPSPENPTFLIRFCPLLFELVENSPNYSELPYRVIWLALTHDEVIIYDSQHSRAIAIIKDITYRNLSDATWTKDGRNIIVSDTEEYIHYIHFTLGEFGNEIKTTPQITDSLCFKKRAARKAMKAVEGIKAIVTPKKMNKESEKDHKDIIKPSEAVIRNTIDTKDCIILSEDESIMLENSVLHNRKDETIIISDDNEEENVVVEDDSVILEDIVIHNRKDETIIIDDDNEVRML